MFDRCPGHLDRVADAVSGFRGEDVHSGSFPHDLKLVHRIGALQITGNQQGAVPLGLQPTGELSGKGGFTRTLQTGEHDHSRRFLGKPDGTNLSAQDADELFVDDLDDLLRWVEGTADLNTAAALLDSGDELLDHPEVDICFQQGNADLPHCGVDVLLRESSLRPEALERFCQAFLKCVEQVRAPWIPRRCLPRIQGRLSACGCSVLRRTPLRSPGWEFPPSPPTGSLLAPR